MMQNVLTKLLFIIGSPALMVLVKTTFIVALGLLLVRSTRAARASVRHLLLACTFAGLLIVPMASLVAPVLQFEMEPLGQIEEAPTEATTVQHSQQVPIQPVTQNTVSSSQLLPSWKTIALFIWCAGVAILLLRLTASLVQLRRARRSAIPCLDINNQLETLLYEAGMNRKIEVLLHNKAEVPFTYGLFRPAILLPNDAATWSTTDLRRVLVHELEHIKRGDWTVQMMARVTCAFYWFQPLVWVAWRRMCLEAERASDDAVVMQTERTDYAEQLVNLAKRLSGTLAPPVLSMANRSDLSHRVSAILNTNQNRGRAGLRWTAASIACSAFVIMAIAPRLAISQTQTPKPRTVSLRVITLDEQPKTPAERKTLALNMALIKATEDGQLDAIEQLISEGADVNGVIDGDGTALIIAARDGNLAAVTSLLKHGADVNKASPGDGNPLIMAAREGHEDVVTLLLDRGALINQVVESDENALIQAAGSGRVGVVKFLVQRGADINARVWSGSPDGEWRTALSMARKHGRKDIADLLTSVGARE